MIEHNVVVRMILTGIVVLRCHDNIFLCCNDAFMTYVVLVRIIMVNDDHLVNQPLSQPNQQTLIKLLFIDFFVI